MPRLKHSLQDFWPSSPPLSLQVLFSLSCLALSLTGLILDPRHINGELAWIKPCKFSISLALYGATLIWLGRFLSANRALLFATSIGALIGTIVELAAIILQALRGTTSHFNTSTPFDHAVFIAVKVAIVPVALAMLVMYVLLLRQRDLPPVLGSALRWGVFLTLIGLIPGLIMIVPGPIQAALTSSRQFDGHTVGSAGGGPGLPWLGWSTAAGDLRVAHFVGLHALQILPIIGVGTTRLFPALLTAGQQSLVRIAGFTYLGSISLLTWQALQGESIASPGSQTLLLAAILIALTLLSTTWTLLPARRESLAGLAIPQAVSSHATESVTGTTLNARSRS